ncbi:MAG: hypothetical protein IT430_14935 [Phycisphaerales bacterium]|nr:hypothetical protein [Phycisphaerales bacterium]
MTIKELFVPHQAGLDGSGTFNYIDSVILRQRDANSGWTCSAPRREGAADGTLEEAADRIMGEADGGGAGSGAHVSAAEGGNGMSRPDKTYLSRFISSNE